MLFIYIQLHFTYQLKFVDLIFQHTIIAISNSYAFPSLLRVWFPLVKQQVWSLMMFTCSLYMVWKGEKEGEREAEIATGGDRNINTKIWAKPMKRFSPQGIIRRWNFSLCSSSLPPATKVQNFPSQQSLSIVVKIALSHLAVMRCDLSITMKHDFCRRSRP